MSAVVQVFSNAQCCPLRTLPAEEHHPNFYRAIAEMEAHAEHPASFMAANLAIIPLDGDERLVVWR